MQGRIEELLGGFGIETPDEFRGVLEIGKEHGHLFAFACQDTARGQDFLREIRWGIGEGGLRRWLLGGGRGGGRRSGVARPPQPVPGIVTHLRMGVEEFGGEIRHGLIVQRELALQGAIRDALALLEERDDLIQNGIKVHARPSLPAAVRVGAYVHAS